jgi:hypothetical protein
MSRRTFRPGVLAACAAALALFALPQAGAPSAAPPYQHVVIISIDGLHEADVADPRLAADLPALHRLARRGVSYANAQTTAPSDSFPGTMAVLTGARPGTTGVYYDETFDRSLTPAGSAADAPRGAVVDLTEDLDRDPSLLDGGGDAGTGSLDPAKLPQRCGPPGCAPLWPHDYPLANTLFDVLGAHGLTGFLVEKHPAYAVAFARGSRHVAFYAPEIDAQVAVDHGRLIDRTSPDASSYTLATVGNDEATAEAYDELKVQAVLRALAGRGRGGATVPALVMLNLQSVNFAQKAATGGIAAGGRPSPRLREALRYTDGAVGRIAALLVERGLAPNTLLVVFAKHGQAPRTGRATLVARSTILKPLRAAGIGVAHLTSDDVALFWLAHRSDAARAARLLAPLGRIVRSAPGPTSSRVRRDRAPDLILVPPPGIVFVGNPAKATKRAEHGGFSSDDRDVPLIVWSTRFGSAAGRAVTASVETRQIAPTVLTALGIDPRQLSGVRAEGTAVLPGLPLP